ncbi:MAG TPA: hypothetical protein PKY38_01950 [Opitutaceae bacterium]|nr:hypothetical protein [Opitutaceae bacterium]
MKPNLPCRLARARLAPIPAALVIVTVGLGSAWLGWSNSGTFVALGAVLVITDYKGCRRRPGAPVAN